MELYYQLYFSPLSSCCHVNHFHYNIHSSVSDEKSQCLLSFFFLLFTCIYILIDEYLTCAFALFRYEDFFGNNKKTVQKKKSKLTDGSDDSDMDFDNQVVYRGINVYVSNKEYFPLLI